MPPPATRGATVWPRVSEPREGGAERSVAVARPVAGHGRGHRVFGQGHHRQAGLPAWRGCGHADHAAHAVRVAAVRGTGLVGRPGQARADGARLARHHAAGLQRLLPGELSRLLGPAVRQRQPGAADPVPGPDAGAAAGPRALPAPRGAEAAAGAGHQLRRRVAGLRPGAQARRRRHRTRCGPGVRQHPELCAVPGVQRRGGQAPGRAAPDRAGHQRGLRAVHRAVPAVAALG